MVSVRDIRVHGKLRRHKDIQRCEKNSRRIVDTKKILIGEDSNSQGVGSSFSKGVLYLWFINILLDICVGCVFLLGKFYW